MYGLQASGYPYNLSICLDSINGPKFYGSFQYQRVSFSTSPNPLDCDAGGNAMQVAKIDYDLNVLSMVVICAECLEGYDFNTEYQISLSICPSGYYKNPSTKGCDPCDVSCSDCTGRNNTECTGYTSGYFLQPESTTCLSTCSIGYCADTLSNTCAPCDACCSNCTGGTNTQCTSCNPGYLLQPSSTTCGTACPSGYYADCKTHVCKRNHFFKNSCSDSFSFNRKTCIRGNSTAQV